MILLIIENLNGRRKVRPKIKIVKESGWKLSVWKKVREKRDSKKIRMKQIGLKKKLWMKKLSMKKNCDVKKMGWKNWDEKKSGWKKGLTKLLNSVKMNKKLEN